MSTLRNILTVAAMCLSTFEISEAQQSSQALQHAIDLYKEEGKPDQAMTELNQLLEKGELSRNERTEARLYLGLIYIAQEKSKEAVDIYKAIVHDDPGFDMNALRNFFGNETPPTLVIQHFAQAILEVRYQELEARKALLSKTSRGGAFLRSALLPGWGQRYQEYKNRGYMMIGMTLAAITYAVITDRDYRKVQDKYDKALVGAKFDDLYNNYTDKGDQADLALGVVGAVWLFNMIDALIQGPNITPGGITLRTPTTGDGVQVVYRARF
jgi:tetratricopeptide (TPR) repeat protein